MNDPASRIAQNLTHVRGRIAEAAARSGRDPREIVLVGVTKYVDASTARLLFEAGCEDLGESRPQQLWEKSTAMADLPVRWHMIGHLQRNKARKTCPLVHLLHSADSMELLAALEPLAAGLKRRLKVLLEVNVSGEAAKHGFSPEAVAPVVEQWPRLANLELCGLMCMAGLESDADTTRREFAALRTLRDRLATAVPPGVHLAHLSMGMSGDYEAAIEEGATLVRVGSALFEGVAR